MNFEKETILDGNVLKGRVNKDYVEFRVQLEMLPPSPLSKLTRKQFLLFAEEIEKTKQEIINENI